MSWRNASSLPLAISSLPETHMALCALRSPTPWILPPGLVRVISRLPNPGLEVHNPMASRDVHSDGWFSNKPECSSNPRTHTPRLDLLTLATPPSSPVLCSLLKAAVAQGLIVVMDRCHLSLMIYTRN